MRVTATLLLLTVAACGGADAGPGHVTLASIDTLRARFNADSGKVRAILLGSPT